MQNVEKYNTSQDATKPHHPRAHATKPNANGRTAPSVSAPGIARAAAAHGKQPTSAEHAPS